MKTFLASLFAILVGLSLGIGDAEAARRLGGGKSVGMQRDSVKPSAPSSATPTQAAPAQGPGAPAAAAAAAPKRSWMGPLAGLAAGLGLAALASHFGFGEGLANFMLIGLLVLVGVVVVRMIFRRRAESGPGLQYAGASAGAGPLPLQPASGGLPLAVASATTPARIPADFDVASFTRQAKLNFIRLQAANDSGNIEDIREFTSPEMFAEIKLLIGERGGAAQSTDVAMLNAEVLEVTEEAGRHVVSVHFHGLLREEGESAAAPFDEIWHLSKPTDGSRGWVVAGIQQTQ